MLVKPFVGLIYIEKYFTLPYTPTVGIWICNVNLDAFVINQGGRGLEQSLWVGRYVSAFYNKQRLTDPF